MKKKIPAHIKGIIAFVVIILLMVIALIIFFPTRVSTWTHGVLLGAGVESISEEELESGEIRPVTEKEQDS